MHPALSEAPPEGPSARQRRKEPPAAVPPAAGAETTNFFVNALFQVVMRVGWIFKTESIVMPIVLDSLGGGAWLRGCLPLLNRLGHSVPPLLASRRIKVMPHKKWALAGCTLVMGLCFLAMSAMWLLPGAAETPAPLWMPVAFLALYAVFFMGVGINQLCLGTLQGKLIPATARGRLLLWSNVIGAGLAIVFAWWLLRLWLSPQGAAFHLIFAFTGVCFVGCAAIAALHREPADSYQDEPSTPWRLLTGALDTLRVDAEFRRLAIVASLFGTSIMLFPHYQALGRETMGLSLDSVILWVIVQNAGTAAFSLLAGPLADRFGNRLVLNCTLFGILLTPLSALGISLLGPSGEAWFYLVFALVGLTPITIRTLTNYTLEIAPPSEHPRYLSSLSLCLAAPIFLSPAVGWLIDHAAGFSAVFLGVDACVCAGWVLTFFLAEPRRSIPVNIVPPVGDV